MNKTFCMQKLNQPFAKKCLVLRHLLTTGKRTLPQRFTHYQVLGIEQDASSEDVRKAFLRLSKECHPDINSHDPKTHDKFVQVNEAYSILSKGLSRRDYDLSLKAKESATFSYRYNRPPPEAESHFYDPQVFSMRDKSQDRYYKSQPYYGVKGLSKVSNTKIVLTCFGIIVAGIILHYFAVRKSSTLHIKALNERDVKTHKMWIDANDPTLFNERLEALRTKIQEIEAKKSE